MDFFMFDLEGILTPRAELYWVSTHFGIFYRFKGQQAN